MSGELAERSCADFTRVLASRAPVPGGGGAAALVGALGAALCSMVGNLTVEHKKCAAVETEIRAVLERAEAVRARLLELIDRDAKVFEPLSRAYAIPKEDPTREKILENATVLACQAPLEMMHAICETIKLLEEMLEKGRAMLISDVGCGALCCGAALESASMNVFVNTKLMQNRREAAKLDAQADTLLSEYLPRARRVADEVDRRLRKGG